MPTTILILAEHVNGALKDITFELLGMAHAISDDVEVKALLLGNGIDDLASELAARGASEVIYVAGPALASYTGDGYQKTIVEILKERAPQMMLIGNTPNGWDVAPLVAARVGVPLATGCSAITLEGAGARFRRKAFNGKFVHEVAVSDQSPLMATVDKGAAAAFEGSTSGTVRKVDASVQQSDLRSRFVEIRKSESGGLDLTQAPVIVSAGRGIGEAEKLNVVRELADALGAQLGASRAVTDAGWLPHEHQIGSSGVTVSPKLYVACGISGAIQHVVGMKGSGYIVAINKDPDAPIFTVADVGVVGDLFEIVPALTQALNEAKR
jgi:electron transfer flavoprotein alpha subunit